MMARLFKFLLCQIGMHRTKNSELYLASTRELFLICETCSQAIYLGIEAQSDQLEKSP